MSSKKSSHSSVSDYHLQSSAPSATVDGTRDNKMSKGFLTIPRSKTYTTSSADENNHIETVLKSKTKSNSLSVNADMHPSSSQSIAASTPSQSRKIIQFQTQDIKPILKNIGSKDEKSESLHATKILDDAVCVSFHITKPPDSMTDSMHEYNSSASTASASTGAASCYSSSSTNSSIADYYTMSQGKIEFYSGRFPKVN